MDKLQEYLSELLNSEKTETNEDCIKNIYYYFTTINSSDLSNDAFKNLISETNQLCSKNILNNNLILISLIANEDKDILNKFLFHESGSSFNLTNSATLFNTCYYEKIHWFEKVLDNCDISVFNNSIKSIINILKLIKYTNIDRIDLKAIENILGEVEPEYKDDLLNFYIQEIKYALNIIEFVKKHSDCDLCDTKIFNYVINNSLLEVFNEEILLSDDSRWGEIIAKLKENEERKSLQEFNLESETKITELNIFTSFSILFTIVKIIRSHCYDFNVNLKVTELVEKITSLDNDLQIHLMEDIFTLCFLQSQHFEDSDDHSFICQDNDVRFILHILKSCFDVTYSKHIYEINNKHDFSTRLKSLNKHVTEALWRFEMITDLYENKKQNIVKYMLVTPETLLYMCLNKGRLDKSHEVIQIFNLHDNPITKEIVITERLQEFRSSLSQTFKIKEYKRDLPQLKTNITIKSPTKLLGDFFSSFEIKDMPEEDTFDSLFDLALTYQGSYENVQQIISLCDTYYKGGNNFYEHIKEIFNWVGKDFNLSISDILNNPNYELSLEKHKSVCEYYTTLGEKFDMFDRQSSHKENISLINQTFMKINELARPATNGVKYFMRLFNYLRIFLKIFYIEQNNTDLLPDGTFTSYFDVLKCNYIDVFGRLIYDKNIDPQDIENSLGKLKIDILYYSTYYSFPMVRIGNKCEDLSYTLRTPTKQALYYVQKRHWMLAYLLTEMYNFHYDLQLNLNDDRTKYFKNYTYLQEVQNLRLLYDDNIIITSLNKNYLEKFLNYLDDKVFDDHKFEAQDSLETAEEIFESDYKCNWKQLLDVANSIPECLIKENDKFYKRKDQILNNLAIDCFEKENFKYVQFIKDIDLRHNIILENLSKWPSSFCITVLSNEISKDEVNADLKLGLENWLMKVKFCDDVMEIFDMKTWFEVNILCSSDKSHVINQFLKLSKLNHLLEYLKIYSAYEIFETCITYDSIKLMFDSSQDLSNIRGIFNKIPKEALKSICFDLIKAERHIKNLKFISNYLYDDLNQRNEDLKLIQISLNILNSFNPNEQEQFLPLLSSPLEIIETLIMNTKLDKLGQILANINPILNYYDCNVINEDCLDKLLRKYAEKSLEFRVVLEPHPKFLKATEYKLLQSLDSQYGPEKREFIMPVYVPDKTEWIPNNEIIECMCCQVTMFSMFNRRHHCRRCGRIICFNCSTRRMIVPSYGKILVRVCIDCYDQTHSDGSSSFNDTISTKSITYDFWILTDDLKNNKIIRQEFSYEHAPSVSLCLSIMKYHSKNLQYTRFLLDQCDTMFELLQPVSPNCPQEIDYPLVIKMLRSLAIAAKMFSTECHLPLGTSEADRILSQVDLLSLLVEKGCLNLIPIPAQIGAPYVDTTILRKLRDMLLETEQWNFALEVSTKAGLDNSGVFAAWGKSCLKAGCLEYAREKFQRCLDKSGYYEYIIDYSQSTDLDESCEVLQRKRYSSKVSVSSDSKPHKNPQLLNQIIQILEKQNMKADYRSIELKPNTDTALFIKAKLKNLKSIAGGKYGDSSEDGNYLNPLIKNECVYYLDKYGNHLSLLRFYLRHNCIRDALMYIVENQVPADVFIEVYMICLKEGTISLLHEVMSVIDSTLDLWKDYLMYICRHLEKQSLLNSLYQLQQYMGDFVRAAMTCIRFYKNNASCYGELLTNLHFLEHAENHFNQELEQQQWVDVNPVVSENPDTFEEKSLTNPSLVMRLKPKHITKNISVIKHQFEVTKFLAGNEMNDKYVLSVLPFLTSSNEEQVKNEMPTLFDSQDEKVKLAALIIICNVENGFPVSLRIIKDFQLKAPKVFSQVGRYLALQDRIIDIKQLINLIRSIDENDKSIIDLSDEVLVLAVRTLGSKDTKTLELDLLIRLIFDKTLKISMYIETKQLKSAYILDAKQKRVGDVRRILREAEMLNKPDIKKLCQRFLQAQPH